MEEKAFGRSAVPGPGGAAVGRGRSDARTAEGGFVMKHSAVRQFAGTRAAMSLRHSTKQLALSPSRPDRAPRFGLHAAAFLLVVACLGTAAPVWPATFQSGSTGADGVFDPPGTVPPGTTMVGNTVTVPLPPSGVLNFTTITIPAGVTVRILRNAANTPVTLLASGDVTVAGTLDLAGQPGSPGQSGASFVPNPGGAGGPGGFDGGAAGGDGLGPEGGRAGASPAFQAGGGGGLRGSLQ